MIAIVSRTMCGGQDVLRTFVGTGRGRGSFARRFEVGARGVHRGIHNDALARYEVYIGVGGSEPDFGAAPAAVGTSLPVEVSLEDDGEYRIVLRRRNSFGVVSENRESVLLVIDDGEVTGAAPGAPRELVVEARGWVVSVRAVYEHPGGAEPDGYAIDVEYPDGSGTDTATASGSLALSNGVAEFMGTFDLEGLAVAGTATVRARVLRGAVEGADAEEEVALPASEGAMGVEGWHGGAGPAYR